MALFAMLFGVNSAASQEVCTGVVALENALKHMRAIDLNRQAV